MLTRSALIAFIGIFSATATSASISISWRIPTRDPYRIPQIVATVNDTLTFTWSSPHNVYISASEHDFDDCVKSGGTELASGVSGGTYTATLPTAGIFYYICTVGGHCASGQKVAVHVLQEGQGFPLPPPPSPPPPLPLPPSPISPPPVLASGDETSVDFASGDPPSASPSPPVQPPPRWPHFYNELLALGGTVVLMAIALAGFCCWKHVPPLSSTKGVTAASGVQATSVAVDVTSSTA